MWSDGLFCCNSDGDQSSVLLLITSCWLIQFSSTSTLRNYKSISPPFVHLMRPFHHWRLRANYSFRFLWSLLILHYPSILRHPLGFVSYLSALTWKWVWNELHVCGLQGYGAPPQYGGAAYAQQPYPGGQQYPAQNAVAVQPTVYVTQGPLANPVNDYMCYSIFTMLCCCLPLGIAALIYSISVSLSHKYLCSLWTAAQP